MSKKSIQNFFIFVLSQLPVHSAFAYTDRSLVSYFTGNILWRLLLSGGYYTLGVIALVLIVSFFSKSFRVYATSFLMAFSALYLLVLIYEVSEEMSWVPPMYS